MTGAESAQFAWDVGGALLGMLGFVAVLLLALSLIGQVRR